MNELSKKIMLKVIDGEKVYQKKGGLYLTLPEPGRGGAAVLTDGREYRLELSILSIINRADQFVVD